MKVLLTGDDGYKALGLRIVATVLKEMGAEVTIAATQGPRSSTGGSFPGKGRWGKDVVEGIEALWVDGMPADSVEVASRLYGKDFDLLVSGLNMGPNVGDISASGTIGAASHGLDIAVAKKAMALSWRVPIELVDQTAEERSVAEFADHPQHTVRQIINLALTNNFWGADFLNCNLPEKKPTKLMICQPTPHPNVVYYGYDVKIDQEKMTYQKMGGPPLPQSGDLSYDAAALWQGYATAVPWLANRYVNEELLKLIGTEINLKGN